VKAVQLVQAGRLPVFERRVVDDPQPGVGEVLVALEATGLNRRDAWLWEQTDLALPSTLGSDGAGIVRAVGEAVSGVRVGDEVVINPGLDWGADEEAGGSSFEILGVPRAGTFADLVVVPSENVAPKPRRLSWEEAATLGVAAITAWRAVTRSTTNLVGARILVPGAGGGVASFAIQIASALGAEVFATSSEQGKLERARQLGAAHAVDYSATAWPAKMRDLCPGGFEAIIDGAGPPLWQALVDLLKPGGTLVTYGLSVGPSAEFASLPLLWQWRKVLGTTMGSPRDFVQLMQHVDESSWRPAIDSVFDMERLPEAAARLGARDRFGKIALLNR
jgi:NADPH:quinone reductase-like Zn-dependent oxidoreductase